MLLAMHSEPTLSNSGQREASLLNAATTISAADAVDCCGKQYQNYEDLRTNDTVHETSIVNTSLLLIARHCSVQRVVHPPGMKFVT